jgi:hypothetical protein
MTDKRQSLDVAAQPATAAVTYPRRRRSRIRPLGLTRAGLREAIMPRSHSSSHNFRLFGVAIMAVVASAMPWKDLCGAEDVTRHWAYRPVVRPAVPAVKNAEWPRTPIDNFILARLERDSISPSPPADAATMLRRVKLDLTGLPPAWNGDGKLVANAADEAYENVVERLLDSPHFGERWAKHWLDVARYADSAGYEFDSKRDIWKYRDWVIKAINEDLPYDEFLIEQLAGDLMEPAQEDRLVATGFSCNALKQGSDPQETIVDRVNAFSTAYLGLTVGCARCHDHKFDPISRTEFCRLYAFFNQADDVVHDFAPPEQVAERDAMKQQIAHLKRELASYQNGPDRDPLVWAARLSQEDLMSIPSELRGAIGMLSKDRSAEQLAMVDAAHREATLRYQQGTKQRVGAWAASLSDAERQRLDGSCQSYLALPLDQRPEDVPTPLINEFWNHDPATQKRKASIAQLEAGIPATITTLVLQQRAENPKTFDELDPSTGVEVTPDVPAALPPLRSSGPIPTRLDLARWAASSENPLTARVAVNRVWQYYFGTGIVETTDNLGVQAPPPSHPELLDWLAAELMEHGWSMKHIHRLIVTSATYRQSSTMRPELGDLDPQNRLLARQNRVRLDAETIRDTSLAASGILNASIGGPSVFPYQPEGIMSGRADGTQWVESKGADRLRRGLYINFWRLTPHPYFRLFDAPDATESCPRRSTSNTPLQALTLLNDPWFTEAAAALANRVLTEIPEQPDDQRLEWMFDTCLGRSPRLEEKQILGKLLANQRQSFGSAPERAKALVGDGAVQDRTVDQAAWTSVARAVLNLDEFITRE